LKSLNVYDVCEDDQGVIWVGTDENLYRHEGDKLVSLAEMFPENEEMEKIVAHEIVYHEGDIWIAGKGLKKISTVDYTLEDHSHTFENSNASTSTIGLTIKNGLIHYCIKRKGLVTYNPENGKATFVKPDFPIKNFENENDLKNNFSPLGYDADSTYWYCSLTGFLSEKNGHYKYHFPELRDAYGIKQATLDYESGKIWGVTWKSGLVSFEIETSKWEYHMYNPKEESTWKYQNLLGIHDVGSHILVSCSQGAAYFDKESSEFDLMHEKYADVTTFGRFFDFVSDNSGRIWLCSMGRGLYMYSPKRNQYNRAKLESGVADAYFDEDLNALVAICHNGYIHCYQEGKMIREYKPHYLDNIYINNISRYKSGFLIGGSIQAQYFDTTNHRLYEIKDVRKNYKKQGYYHSVFADENENIITSSQDGSIYIYKESFSDPIIIDENECDHLLPKAYSTMQYDVDENGHSWFLSENQIISYDPHLNKVSYTGTVIPHQNNTTSAYRHTMKVAGDKVVFGNFINELDFILKDDLSENIAADLSPSIVRWPKSEIRDLTYDGNRFFYVSSVEGLGVIDLENGTSHLYGRRSGLDHISHVIPAGRNSIYLTKGKNVIYVDIRRLTQDSAATPIIVDVQIDEEPNQSFNRFQFPFVIGPEDYLVNFKIVWPEYDDDGDRAFRIGMSDSETNYSYTRFPYIRIGNIKNGRHNISYSVSSSSSPEWINESQKLKVKVVPYIYQTAWFYSILFLLAVLLIWMWFRRRAKIQRKELKRILDFNRRLAETEMKALRAQMNPHFLFNVLNGIKLKVQKKEHVKAIEFITDFSKLIRSVLQNSSKAKITLSEELEALSLYVSIEKRRFRNEFIYDMIVDEEIDMNAILIPPLLLQPYVENSIWHGILHKTEGSGQIKIKVAKITDESAREGIEIRITDNGIGRKKARELKSSSGAKSKSMGMQITKDRMELNNQYLDDNYQVEIIDLYDELGKAAGTQVLLTM